MNSEVGYPVRAASDFVCMFILISNISATCINSKLRPLTKRFAYSPSAMVILNNSYVWNLRLCLCFRHIRRLVRDFSLRRDSGQMSALSRNPVNNGRMRSNSVVPHNDSLWLPSHTCLVVDAATDVIKQELEKVVALLFLQPIDGARD
jgi:hypothetical protein